VDQFCDKLRDRLDTIEGRLQTVKKNIKGMPAQTEKALREKLEEARSKLQAQKSRIEQTRANLEAGAKQRMAETKEVVSEWKAKHETEKLNARANRAERYAADAFDNAAASIDESEEAILWAELARMDAFAM
jgi:ABC-type transporter Mla subunit MlaD